MARYIDADKAHEEIDTFQTSLESNDDKVWRKNKPYYKGLAIARGIINEIPTADVVEVVRCKECNWARKMVSGNYSCCVDHRLSHDENDFCSYGERRAE